MSRKSIVISVLLILLLVAFGGELMAQCPMCKMAAESNLKNGGNAGKGLNTGILYMLATPYLLVAGLGLYWYRNQKKVKQSEVS